MRRTHTYPSSAADEPFELVDRCLLTLVDPTMLDALAAYASAAQSASTQQNVASAQNVKSPNSTQFASSTMG